MAEAKFEPLITQLTALTSATDAVIALVDSMASDVLAAKDDPAEIEEIVAGYKAQSDKLAAAVAANTPAEPAPGGGEPGGGEPVSRGRR